MRSTM